MTEAADEFRNLHRFEAFAADDVEQLVRKGEVPLERAVAVLYEYDGPMGSAKAALDAHGSDTHGGVRRFREGVQDFQEGRSSSRGASENPATGASESTGESDAPEPADGTNPRGTVVIPRNKHYLQKLEARARDGQARLVETAYALTGQTYTRPTDLMPLDDNEFYLLSTRTSTNHDVRGMAEEVAGAYSGWSPPKVVAKFHTHPRGVPSPQRQQPRINGDQLVWDDETFRHWIAVYGPEFRTHTVGCNYFKIFATPMVADSSQTYSRQYQKPVRLADD